MQRRTAFEQERSDLPRGEPLQRRPERAVARDLDLRAPVLERLTHVGTRRRRRLRHDNDRAGLSCREHARRRRRAETAIEDDTDERPLSIDAAGRQERIVAENRSDPDADRVDLGPHAVRVPIRRR